MCGRLWYKRKKEFFQKDGSIVIMVTRDGAKCKQLLGGRFSIVLWKLSTTRFFFFGNQRQLKKAPFYFLN